MKVTTKKLHPQNRGRGSRWNSNSRRFCYYGETKRAVCVKCRKCFHVNVVTKCPECGTPAYDAGTHFRPPKKNDKKAWNIIKDIFEKTNKKFYRDGSGFVPSNAVELREYLKSKRIYDLQLCELWKLIV